MSTFIVYTQKVSVGRHSLGKRRAASPSQGNTEQPAMFTRTQAPKWVITLLDLDETETDFVLATSQMGLAWNE